MTEVMNNNEALIEENIKLKREAAATTDGAEKEIGRLKQLLVDAEMDKNRLKQDAEEDKARMKKQFLEDIEQMRREFQEKLEKEKIQMWQQMEVSQHKTADVWNKYQVQFGCKSAN